MWRARSEEESHGQAQGDVRRGRCPGGATETAPTDSVYLGKSVKPEFILLRLANRHGLITGATGTGKTVTLQGLAEGFSDLGVPVFCADVKSDLSGLAEAGTRETVDRGARQGDRLQVRVSRLSRDLLGSVRRAGPSDPLNGF